MNAEQDLSEAYQAWHRLAGMVGQGIEQGDWNQVAICQQAIRELQARISRLTPLVWEEWTKTGSDLEAKEAALNETIRQVGRLARRNHARITEKKEAVRLKLDGAAMAVRNLRQIRRSFVLNRPSVGAAFA